jgi:hypothetical protein
MQELENDKNLTLYERSIINHKIRKNNRFSDQVREDIQKILKKFQFYTEI